MKRLHTFVTVLGFAAAASASLVGCGGDDTTCGTGTVLQGDMCVPTTSCGTGTVLTAGECVPDGTVICEQGTRFDTATGTCVVDPSACAAGTVLVGGECVPEDETLTADLEEAVEPNETAGAGDFDVPALNAMVTIHGCITPRAGAADEDVWIMEAAGPTLVEITADGVGGLAAGFIVQDNGIVGLENYSRFGINLTGDTSKRQVYLPKAGVYLLVMDDSRALLLGEAAGSADACYYGTIKTVPMPTATPLTFPLTTGEDSGNVRVLSYDPDGEGDILDIAQTTASTGMLPAFIVRKNGQFHASAAYDQTNDVPPFYTIGGLAAADTVEIVVDEVYNFSITPQPYELTSFDIPAQALPVDGSVVTVTKRNGTTPAAAYADLNYLYFDVQTAGQILHWNLTSSIPIDMVVVRSDIFTPAGAFDALANINAFGGTGVATFNGQFIRFPTPGRYYFVTQDPAATTPGATFTITSTLTNMPVTPVVVGTPLTAQALPAQGSGFHSVDLTNPIWMEFGVTGTNWGAGNARVEVYDLAGFGWLNNNYATVFAANQAPTGAAPFGRIMARDTRDFLVRVSATAATGTGPTYDLSVANRPHTNLQVVAPGTPVNQTATAIPAGGSVRYFAMSAPGNLLRVVATPSDALVDISIERRNADESIPTGGTINGGGAGAAETLTASVAALPNDWVAYTLTNRSATLPVDIATVVTAITPRPYVITSGTLPFVDACAGGTTLGTNQDDEYMAVRTLPGGWNFQLFGETVSQYIIAANGFIKFGNTNPTCSFGCFSNTTLPNAAEPTGGMLAPFWDDQDGTTICVKEDAVANTVTVQWTGAIYVDGTILGALTQYQTVFHMNGVIDYIYGPAAAHVSNGATATVGAENLSGGFGHQISFNAAINLAGTSRTLTPM